MRIEGLDGTGTFLGIDVNGDVTKTQEVDGSTTNELPTEGSMIDVSGTAVSVDINELTEGVDELNIDGDFIPIYDESEAINKKVTPETLLSDYRNFRMHRFEYFNEFMSAVGTTAGDGQGVSSTASGTGAAASGTGANSVNAPGECRITTGSTATGRVAVTSAVSAIALGGGEWVYECEITGIAALSDVTNRYQLLIGFFDTYTAANQVDGVYFLYDEGGVSTGSAASANWQQVTSSNSVRTFNTTATAVATGSTILTIVVNAAGTLATFYIDGVCNGNNPQYKHPYWYCQGYGVWFLRY